MRMCSSFLPIVLVGLLLPAGAHFAGAQTTTAPLTKKQLLNGLDADMLDVVQLYNVINGTPAIDLTPQDARQQIPIQEAAKILARSTGLAKAPKPVGKVIDGLTVPGRGGNEIPIRIYQPTGTGPFPVIVYYHGGGFVLATIDTYDGSARALCADADAIVVSVEYRKAPEAPFPAARVDAIDAYIWVTNNIATYNGLARKVAVAGESAGGNLAIEVALTAVNTGLQVPTHELLVYPETTDDLTQASDLLYTNAVLPLNTALLQYLNAQYLHTPSDANAPESAPFTAVLRGLPPTTIIAAEEDPLRSDGEDLFTKLKATGIPVTYRLYTGTTHEFFGMGDFVAKARAAEAFGAARLKASF